MSTSLRSSAWLLQPIRAIHGEIRRTVVAACDQLGHDELAHVMRTFFITVIHQRWWTSGRIFSS